MNRDKPRTCARCGRDVHVNTSRVVAVVICRDCRAADAWYLLSVTDAS